MDTTIIETSYSLLNFRKESCATFDTSSTHLKKLTDYGMSTSGIITIHKKDFTCVAKFVYSSLGDDGHIEMIIGDYSKYSSLIKHSVVGYVLSKLI